jgi:hypothetical protein
MLEKSRNWCHQDSHPPEYEKPEKWMNRDEHRLLAAGIEEGEKSNY